MLHYILGIGLITTIGLVSPKLLNNKAIDYTREKTPIKTLPVPDHAQTINQYRPSIGPNKPLPVPNHAQTSHRWLASLASIRYCHDPVLALKIMKVESNFNNTRAKGESSTGIMQVKPETARWIGCTAKNERDLLNIELNIQCGCFYLGKLAHRYSNKIKEIIVAYNAGSAIKCRTGQLNNGRSCTIGEYINEEYYNKVTGVKL